MPDRTVVPCDIDKLAKTLRRGRQIPGGPGVERAPETEEERLAAVEVASAYGRAISAKDVYLRKRRDGAHPAELTRARVIWERMAKRAVTAEVQLYQLRDELDCA